MQVKASQSYDDVQAFFGQPTDVPFPSPQPHSAPPGASRLADSGPFVARGPPAMPQHHPHVAHGGPAAVPYYMVAPQHSGMLPVDMSNGPPEAGPMMQHFPAYPGQPSAGYMMVPRHVPYMPMYPRKAAQAACSHSGVEAGPHAEPEHMPGHAIPKCAVASCNGVSRVLQLL